MSASSTPDPGTVFETLTAYQRSAVLKAAIDVDLFTAVGHGHTTAATLARACQASERGMRILADGMVVLGFLTKTQGQYGLTPTAAMFLDRRSPACMGSVSRFLNAPQIGAAFTDVAAAVRKGGTIVPDDGTLGPEHPIWVDFARAMAPAAGLVAGIVAGALDAAAAPRWRVLDLAAGHGLFGIALATQNPNAEIVAQDWANVLAVAQENARTAGVADRFRTLPGSAFDVEFGGDYDLVLLTNFLHHFDAPTCEALLRKVHAALRPGGRAVTVEFVPNEDRTAPADAVLFSCVMLATTPAGDTYTFTEYDGMFRRAGFARSELRSLAPAPQQMLIAYR